MLFEGRAFQRGRDYPFECLDYALDLLRNALKLCGIKVCVPLQKHLFNAPTKQRPEVNISSPDARILAKETIMFSTKKLILGIVAIVGIFIIGSAVRNVVAGGQTPATSPKTPISSVPTIRPASQKVAAGEVEAKRLLLLMDDDKSGKVSRAEFMSFMAAEFDRLDINHDGELDVKELEQSQLETAHRGGTHR